MIKYALLALIAVMGTFTSQVTQAQDTAYVVDDLYTFMHSGAGKNYRIIGSVNAGTEVKLTGAASNEFVEVIDDKDRTGWVESKFIQSQPSLKIQHQQLGEELAQTQQALRKAQSELPEIQKQNQQLQLQVEQLQGDLQLITDERDTLAAQQASVKSKEKRQLLTYGGAIAFIGLFLGIILTVILSRRKKYDGWA